MTVSFVVERIIETKEFGLQLFETELRNLNGDGYIIIRGRPWKTGEKVDFSEINAKQEQK